MMKARADELKSAMYLEFGNLLMEFDCHDDAARFLMKSMNLSEKLGDSHSVRRSLQNLGKTLLRRGNFELAETFFKKCIDMHDDGNPGYDVFPLLGLVDLYRFTGKFEEAEKAVEKAAGIIDLMPVLNPYLKAAQSGLYMDTGRYREALDVINAMWEEDGRESRGELWIELLSRRGWCYYQTGENEKAAESFRLALSMAEDKDVPYRESSILAMMSMLEAGEGDPEKAKDHAKIAVDKAVKVGSDLCLSLASEAMAGALRSGGRPDEGKEYSKFALSVSRKINQQSDSCASLVSMAKSFFDQGRHDDALNYAYRVLQYSGRDLNPQRKESLLIIGKVFHARGLHEEAASVLKPVLEWSKTSGNKLLREQAEQLLGTMNN